MRNSKVQKIEKLLLVIASLIVGVLMPYLSRIPLALTYGAPRIWRYIDNFEDFTRWNVFHLGSLIPVLIFGVLYISGNTKWTFYAAVFGHFVITILIYCRFGEPNFHADDFLGCILFPPVIAAASFLCGIIALFIELFASNRKLAVSK